MKKCQYSNFYNENKNKNKRIKKNTDNNSWLNMTQQWYWKLKRVYYMECGFYVLHSDE